MIDAWAISRRAAKRYGYPAKAFIAQALRQAWARAKAVQVPGQQVDQPRRVYTVCVDERLTSRTKLRDQLVVEAYFTDYNAAQAARALLATAYTKPFIKTQSTCFA